MRIRYILLVAALATPRIAAAQSSDSAAVVAVVQRFFDGMTTKDSVASRAVLVKGAHLSSMRSGGTGAVRHTTDSAYITQIAASKQKLVERMWNPSVRVSGEIATLMTPYDFHIDGKFSHCGVDVFDLLKTPTGWQIVNIVYTVQPQGCTPSPLGPVTP